MINSRFVGMTLQREAAGLKPKKHDKNQEFSASS